MNRKLAGKIDMRLDVCIETGILQEVKKNSFAVFMQTFAHNFTNR